MTEIDEGVGWLSPTGEFIAADLYSHYHIACELVEKLGYKNISNLSADDLLLDNGWVHISLSLLYSKQWRITWDKFLTVGQINYLKKYYNGDIPIHPDSLIRWEKEVE